MEEKIMLYNSSYTDEENARVHEYVENASEKEVAELIRELQKIYENDVPEIHNSIKQLETEVRQRDILNQKYEELKKCNGEWGKYITSLKNYMDVLILRKKYAEYKLEESQSRKSVDNFINEHGFDSDMPATNDDFIKRALLSESAAGHIKKPQETLPVYASLDDIPIKPFSDNESLESIGKNNLKYLLLLMLRNVDSPNAPTVPMHILFLTRMYSRYSHKQKKKLSPFKTTLLSTPDLYEKNMFLLNEILEKQKETEKLIAEIAEME